MANVYDTLKHLSQTIDKSSFADETARYNALKEAKAVVRRLETPWERTYDMVWFEPLLMIAIEAASDLGVFSALTAKPQSSEQLVKASKLQNADPALVGRLCRLLAAGEIVEEVDADMYRETDISQAYAAPKGLINGIHHFFDVGVPQLAGANDYFRETGFKNPTDAAHPPWQTIFGSDNMWNWFKGHPEAKSRFQAFLASLRSGQVAWPEIYPPAQLLGGYDPSTVLCVDVGGGKGADMRQFATAVSSEVSELRIVVQDLPEVIDVFKTEHQVAGIEPMPHNFFESQPIKGARAYFMHSICHDWPDSEAHKILTKLREAGTPGYSKLLLLDGVVPAKISDGVHRIACMDVNMMLHFSALERTAAQWKSVLEGAGWKFKRFWEVKGAWQAIIEAEM